MLLGIVADDLTGALDTAAPFRARGFRTETWLGPPERWPAGPELPDVVAVDTETRGGNPQNAAAIARRCAAQLRQLGARQLYLKIDSTLRGNWVEALVAVREAVDAPQVVICPAF